MTDLLDKIVNLFSAKALHDTGSLPSNTVALPNGLALKSTEEFLNAPLRMRATFNTHLPNEFTDYLLLHCVSKEAAVFLNQDTMSALGVIDYGTHQDPQWASHKAVLTLKPTPEYAALLQLLDKPLDQRTLIEWIEDWGQDVSIYAGNTLLSEAEAIAGLRSLTLDNLKTATFERHDFKSSLTAAESLALKAKEGQPHPTRFVLKTTLYDGLMEVAELSTALILHSVGDKPLLKLRIIKHEEHKNAAAKGLVFLIQNAIEEIPIHLGSVTI